MILSDLSTKDSSEIIKNILTCLGILIGGGWSFWRFVLQREANPKIEFNLDLKIIGIHKEHYIVEVIAIVQNKGLVRHYVRGFSFDLLYLSDKHPIEEGDERINHQILFEKKISKRYWIPEDWHYSFIDAGITQQYTYTTALPLDTKFALIYAQFKYPDEKSDFHTAQKTFLVQAPKVDSILIN